MVRTRAEGGTWPKWWKVTGGGCCPGCAPAVMYMTFFTAGKDQIHTDFEVQVKAPAGVVITSAQLWFIDTTDPTADLKAAHWEHIEREAPVLGLAGAPPQPTIIPRSGWWGNLPAGEITAPGGAMISEIEQLPLLTLLFTIPLRLHPQIRQQLNPP